MRQRYFTALIEVTDTFAQDLAERAPADEGQGYRLVAMAATISGGRHAMLVVWEKEGWS